MNTLAKEGNLAYEYKRFEEKKSPKIQKLDSAPKPEKRISVFRILCVVVVVSALLSALVYTRVVQAELSKEYDTMQKQINEVKSENSRLQIQLEERFSLENLEQIAKTDLGLDEVRPQQIEYVEFDSEPKAEVVERHSFWDDLRNWWNGLFE